MALGSCPIDDNEARERFLRLGPRPRTVLIQMGGFGRPFRSERWPPGPARRAQLFTDYLGWFPDHMPRQGPQEGLGQS
jgi:hypothetical protein